MRIFHPRVATAALGAVAILIGHIPAGRVASVYAEDVTAPALPEITPEELKELAGDPLCKCRAPTAEEQKVLDADPDKGLDKLGAITEDELKGLLGDLEKTGKELKDRGEEMLAEVKLKQTVEPKYHVHYKFDEAKGTFLSPSWRTGKFHGLPFENTMQYYKARPPDVVVRGDLTIDEFEKLQKKHMKPEPPLQYMMRSELDTLAKQTTEWEAADDVEPVLGVRVYKYGDDKNVQSLTYVALIGQHVGIAYGLHASLPGIWILNDRMPGFGAYVFEAKLVLTNIGWGKDVSRKDWFAKSKAHVLDQLKQKNEGERAYFLYQLLGALPISGTLVELEKIVNGAPEASWGKFGLNLFRDIGLITIFIPGGTALVIGLVADAAVVVLAFAIDDKDKWSHLKWTAGTMGIVAAARIGSVMRGVALMVKAGKMVAPKAWAATKAALAAYIVSLGHWRDARKKPCLKVKRTSKTSTEVAPLEPVVAVDGTHVWTDEAPVYPAPDDPGTTDGDAWELDDSVDPDFLAWWYGETEVLPAFVEIDDIFWIGPWAAHGETCTTIGCSCGSECGYGSAMWDTTEPSPWPEEPYVD